MKLKKLFMGLVGTVFAFSLFVGAHAGDFRYSVVKRFETDTVILDYQGMAEFGNAGYVSGTGELFAVYSYGGGHITQGTVNKYSGYVRVNGYINAPYVNNANIYADVYR